MMSVSLNGPFLTSSVVVLQLRNKASCRPGSATPLPASASSAVAISFKLSRGGNFNQRVIARYPPGRNWRR